jgi:hypothetical protein
VTAAVRGGSKVTKSVWESILAGELFGQVRVNREFPLERAETR